MGFPGSQAKPARLNITDKLLPKRGLALKGIFKGKWIAGKRRLHLPPLLALQQLTGLLAASHGAAPSPGRQVTPAPPSKRARAPGGAGERGTRRKPLHF